jgi:LacI family transcriptional regulator
MRKLAALAGVSRTTISMALRNDPCIPESTRKAIVELAEKHGYVPDPVVSTLMNQLRIRRGHRQVEKLAYLTWWPTAEGWLKTHNDYHYYQGARARAKELGYEVEHFWAKEPRMSAARLSKILKTRNIRGLIMAPLPHPRGHLKLEWDYFAAVMIALGNFRPDFSRVSHNHISGMQLAIRRLRHKGYRRIGLCNLIGQTSWGNSGWHMAYLHFQESLPPRHRVPPLLLKEWDPKALGDWVEQHQVQAVLSNMQDPLFFLRDLGYRVPEDIGYASLDRLRPEDPWAGVDQIPEIVAASAVDIVTSLLQRHEYGIPTHSQTVTLEGVWREGPSLRYL